MVSYRGFRLIAILLAVMVTFPMAAKSGKIRFVLGEEENRQIISPNGKSTPARLGNKVKEKDMIKTGLESRVVVALPDGSTISVEENSLVEFTNLNSENGVQTAMTEIKSGTVKFDAQRQTGNSSFKFKTGTATAAIRGTHGGIGKNRRGFGVFGLNSGLMDVDDKCGIKESINSGELVVITPECKASKFKSNHAGDKETINKILSVLDNDSTKMDAAEIQKILNNLDKFITLAIEKKMKEQSCTAGSLPDTVTEASLPLSISCTAISKEIQINETSAAQNAKTFEFSADWAPNAIGAKKFNFTCIDTLDVIGEAQKLKIPADLIPENKKTVTFAFPCGSASTYYYNAEMDSTNKANLDKIKDEPAQVGDSKSSVELTANIDDLCSNGAITVNGTFNGIETSTKQAIVVTFILGKDTKILNVPSVEKTFSYSIPVKDKLKNWNETALDIKVKFPDGNVITKNFPVSVNKSCKTVNTTAPTATITLLPQANKCEARYKISENKDDEAIASIYSDNFLLKEFVVQGNGDGRFNLESGNHTYKFTVKDQAQNETSTTKFMRCLDNNAAAYISIDGSRTPVTKTMRIPPNIPGGSTEVHHTMHIKINKLKNNDYSQVESITATQTGVSGNIFYLSNSNKAIDRLDFDIPVELDRNTNSTVTVKVKLYNGRILENRKIFKVREKNR